MRKVYKRKGFEFVLLDDKVLVRDSLQVFYLRSLVSPTYINAIRECIERGEIHDMNDLFGHFYKEDEYGCRTVVVNMVGTAAYRNA